MTGMCTRVAHFDPHLWIKLRGCKQQRCYQTVYKALRSGFPLHGEAPHCQSGAAAAACWLVLGLINCRFSNDAACP